MKKSIILSVVSIMLISAVNAQTEIALGREIKPIKKEEREERKALRNLEGKEVSYRAKEQFHRDFGNAPILGTERSNNFDEFTFTKDGKATTAFYDADANLVGTTQIKTFADLPAKAQQNIHKMYRDYVVGEVILFDDNEFNDTDMILYGNQFSDEDSYFLELVKDTRKIVVQANMNGEVSYYARMR